LGECADLRKQWATKAELGFELPEISTLDDPHPHPTKLGKPKSAPLRTHHLEQVTEVISVPSYVASDDDLPAELFEPPTEALAEFK
jgi:hypothetical protein